jgi:predicted DNA-binding protein with PD1-like motif
MAGGHLKATTVLYTAEIELRPTVGGAIGRKFDPETGTGFWEFKD